MLRSTLQVARRRWWVLVLAPVIAANLALLLTGEPETRYRAEAVVLVPSGAGDDGPGGASQAGRLATVYADLISVSDRIVGHIADVTGTDPDDVRERLSVVTVDSSSLLRLSITSDDPDVAVASIDALLDAVRFGVGGQDSIPRLFLLPVSQDVAAEVVQGDASAGLALAVLVGIVIGVAAAVALERTDVRVDAAELAARRTGVPGSDLDELPDASLVVLLRHWVESTVDRPCTLALLGVERAQHATTAAAANRLVDVAAGHLLVVPSDDDQPARVPDADVDVRLGGAPGTSEAGEWVAADRSHTVLVVPRGARLRDLDAAVQALRRLRLGPSWLVVTRRSRRSGTSPVTEWRQRLEPGEATASR